MSNFQQEFIKGQKGNNLGLYIGDGLRSLNEFIYGLQRGMAYGLAAAPKVGKSTITDYILINAIIDAISKGIEITVTYFSFEMDRVSKEFDFACYFLNREYGISYMYFNGERTYKGQNYVPLSSSLLRGRVKDDAGEIILINDTLSKQLLEVYNKWIILLFGEYDARGLQKTSGYIDFVPKKENPTGLRNKLQAKAEQSGQFILEEFTDNEGVKGYKKIGYVPNNPNAYHIVVTDTIRKVAKERGFSPKETIDKYLEYCTELKKLCGMTFIHIVHLNRGMSDVSRLKYLGEELYPAPEDIKDTGNLSEEADFIITLFNPNDDRYMLKKHFGKVIRDKDNKTIYPGLRTIHIVESRHVDCPMHFRAIMHGSTKSFTVANLA